MDIRPQYVYTAFFICIIVLSNSVIIEQFQKRDTAFIPSDLYDSKDVITNQDFMEQVSFGVAGDSGEFTHQYVPAENDTQKGYATLNWTHTPGIELDYNVTEGRAPSCQDYCFFWQDFRWTSESLPSASNLSIHYKATSTGTFHLDTWPRMYEIHTWLVGPGGDWYRISIMYGGNEEYIERYDTFGDWATNDVFRALVMGGNQSSARLVVGLVPSPLFLTTYESEPWKYYNGSVIVNFYHINLNVLYRTENDFKPTEEPMYQTSWMQGDSDRYRDSCLLPDGTMYVLTTYERNSITQGSSLTKLTARAEVLWRKTWNDTNFQLWYSLSANDDVIYLIGSTESSDGGTDALLVGLDSDGNQIIEKTFDYSNVDSARAIQISQNGDIYLGIRTSLSSNYLLKLNYFGEAIWEHRFEASNWDEVVSIELGNYGHIYTLTSFQLCQWTEDGQQEWEIIDFFGKVFALSDDSVLVTRDERMGETNLTKYTVEGEKDWSQLVRIQYTEEWEEYIEIRGIAESTDEFIYLLVSLSGFHPGRLIIKLWPDGSQVANYTIVISQELYEAYNHPQYQAIQISGSNLIYLSGRILDEDWFYSTIVAVYSFEALFPGVSNEAILMTTGAAAVLIMVFVVFNVFERRKKSARL